MLEVKLFDNNKNNDWLVRQFEVHRFNGSSIADKFIPRPHIFVVFHFRDRPLILGNPPIQLEPIFAAPIIPQVITLKFHGNMDTFVAICRPTVFSSIFGIDLSPVPKRSIDLPLQLFSSLWAAMADLNTIGERMAHFTGFINSVQKTPYHPDPIDILYDKIIGKSITTPLKDIMPECGSSKSTLIRKFIKRTGVNPKTLARIVRLDYLWEKIRNENAIDYQDLVFDGNYFDQSHFINDFKAIIGETPGFFLTATSIL